MRKVQNKGPSRPGSGALEVINSGTMTTGESASPGSVHFAPQESNSGRQSAPSTPKKTVNLVAVKRKEEPSNEDLAAMSRLALADPTSAEAMCSIATDTSFRATAAIQSRDSDKLSTSTYHGDGDKVLGSSDNSSNSSDGNESDSDSDPTTAPNEMKLEFLDCVMKKEYQNAAKLCRMILIYEPNNVDALRFQDVIQQKIEQDASNGLNERSSSDEDSDSEDDTDDDDDENSDEDDKESGSGDDSDTDDDDDDDDGEEEEGSTDDEENGSLTNGQPSKCNGTGSNRR